MTSIAFTLILASAPSGLAQQPLPLGQPQPLPPGVQYPQVLPAQPIVVPQPIPVSPLPVFNHIPNHREFAAAFRPMPGDYKVLILHPRTCKPVEVCFSLPPGCPKLNLTGRMIEYDYGHVEVEIKFRLFGRVTVEYDD